MKTNKPPPLSGHWCHFCQWDRYMNGIASKQQSILLCGLKFTIANSVVCEISYSLSAFYESVHSCFDVFKPELTCLDPSLLQAAGHIWGHENSQGRLDQACDCLMSHVCTVGVSVWSQKSDTWEVFFFIVKLTKWNPSITNQFVPALESKKRHMTPSVHPS